MESDANKKLKLAKTIVVVAVVIMTVMAVVIIMDNVKLMKAEFAFNQGYNKCAALCNAKLDLYRERCFFDIAPDNIDPVLNDSQLEDIMIVFE